MKKLAPLIPLVAMLGAFSLAMRFWWLHTGLERYYILDYARLRLHCPSFHSWPYRIEQIYNLSPLNVPRIFNGEPLYRILLYPLLAAFLGGVFGMFLASLLLDGSALNQGKVLRGPKMISNLAWKWRMMGKKKGFYIAQ